MASVGAAPARRDREHMRYCVHCCERMTVAHYYSAHVCAGQYRTTNTEGGK